MKVEIGPYINRWTTSSFEDWCHEKIHKKPSFEINEEDYTKLDHFIDWIGDKWQVVLNYTINKYLDNKKRKVSIRVDDYDLWSADYTIALIIHPVLIKLKEKQHGYTLVDDSDVPDNIGLRSSEAPPREEWEVDDNASQRWGWVLDEMIWTFKQLIESAPAFDDKGWTEYQERIQNGLRLFGKYYQGLWD